MHLYDTVNIAGCYLPALINGDESGLSDEDIALLDKWMKETSGMCVTYSVNNDDYEFTADCVSGLLADCYSMDIFEL